jgi:hypothetical protein
MLTLEHSLPRKDITDMAFDLGEDNTVAIAEIAAGLREYGGASVGAGTSVYARRMQSFGDAVKRVQNALLEYRAIAKSNPTAAATARQKVTQAYQSLQKGFKHEVDIVTTRMRASRATVLSRPNRALDVARRSGRVAKLRVFDEVQASRLVRFGRYGRYLGNSLVVIDFGSRIDKIHDSYYVGEDWCREMFIESSSFAASAGAGLGVVYGGSALIAKVALTTVVAATPAGWVLVVVGIVVAAAAATTSILVDNKIKENAGSWYDAIMKRTKAK